MDRVTVTTFYRFMTAGRTSPALVAAEALDGTAADDYVVKLKGGVDHVGSLLNELVAAELAEHFGIGHPRPAIVTMEPELIEISVNRFPDKREILIRSAGENFGTQMLTNLISWPTDRSIPEGLLNDAAAIFAFDALIQNPDRRVGNPNLGIVGDQLKIFDHEAAFSFLFAIFPSNPWSVDSQTYLRDHVFARGLRGKGVQLDSFMDCLQTIPEDFALRLYEQVPTDWPEEPLQRIDRHLLAVRQNATQFENELKRLFA